MRDPNRLYKFYNELMRIHMENFPDWRFGQLIENIDAWIYENTNRPDIFYCEEDEFLDYVNKFIKECF